jgi:hypothetical protein
MLFCSNFQRSQSLYVSPNGMTQQEIASLNRQITRRRWSPGLLGYLTLFTLLFGIIFTVLLFKLL